MVVGRFASSWSWCWYFGDQTGMQFRHIHDMPGQGRQMRTVAFAFAAVSFLGAVPAFAEAVSKDPARAPTGTYVVDTKHTQVLFSTLHLGLTDYHGRFDKISGTLTFDGKQP